MARLRGVHRVVNFRAIVAAVLVLVAGAALILGWRVGLSPNVRCAQAQSDAIVAQRSLEEEPTIATAGVYDIEELDRVPGIQRRRPVPADLDAEVGKVAAARERSIETMPDDFPPVEVPKLPDNPLAPPRMDSGDPDPDRLTAGADTLVQTQVKGVDQ
jgi:hypothetical protein